MHFYDMAETWEFNGDPRLLYTLVIFQEGDRYFSAKLFEKFASPENLMTIKQDSLEEIPVDHIWPPLEDGLSICDDPEKPDVYIKRPRLTGYDGSASLGSLLIQEARVCQILMRNEHPNIARYLGCVANDGRVTGLCFERYSETLAERLQDGRPVDQESCFQQIRAGINHLHSLNLVHNDIRLGNIMALDNEGKSFVVIDFDSCAAKGCPLPEKRGQIPEGTSTAEFENDDLRLRVLKEELCQMIQI